MSQFSPISAVQGHAKYKQARDSIYQHIVKSGARPGDKIGTEAVFIKALGISVTTVRRALDELVREGVLVRRVGKGTFFKSFPKANAESATSVLLLGHNSWHFLREDVYFGRILNAFSEKMRKASLRQVVMINEWGSAPEAEIEDIRRHHPAAIIYPFVDSRDQSFLLSLAALGVPLLVYGHPIDAFHAAQVYFDEYDGGAKMASHLLRRGYSEIGVVAPPEESPAGQMRRRGFADTLHASGRGRVVAEVVAREYGEMAGYEAATQLLRDSRPRAIFCAGDLLAYGAMKRAAELGFAVPGDIAIAGYGDFTVSSFYHPRLTTIQLGLPQMGRVISDWASGAVGAAPAVLGKPFVRKLPVKLIVRDTA